MVGSGFSITAQGGAVPSSSPLSVAWGSVCPPAAQQGRTCAVAQLFVHFTSQCSHCGRGKALPEWHVEQECLLCPFLFVEPFETFQHFGHEKVSFPVLQLHILSRSH